MPAAVLKKQFEAFLPLDWQSRQAPELARTGVPEVDAATGGLPRGCLTEIFGPASSGRTSLLRAILREAAARGEECALVDAEDAFDPVHAAEAGVRLERLLWVRCGHNAEPLAGRHCASGAADLPYRSGNSQIFVAGEHALKAADLLLQGGGFGLVAMDLGDTYGARRISLASWFRLRRAVEHTPTILVTLARQSNAKTCASLMLECARREAEWRGKTPGRLLRGIRVEIARRKPVMAGAIDVRFPLR